MTAEQRTEWRRLTEAATAGPWAASEDGEQVRATGGYFMGPDDGRFIAASRTALPVLLDAIDRVLALHETRETEGVKFCVHDPAVKWPCATVRAIEGAS